MQHWPVGCAPAGALPSSVDYLGVAISPVMVDLATSRLAAWTERAKVVLVDGSLPLPDDDGFAGRVLPTTRPCPPHRSLV
ncbi:hypothetical protein [Mycobacterium sp.]|uniref:hypothetical protein n=2 Tax=Mycobacterium sp. TaxID=1785 RepID=UPI003F94AB7F